MLMFMKNNLYKVVPIEKYIPRIDLNATYLNIKGPSKSMSNCFQV